MHRIEKVNSLIQQQLSQILLQRLGTEHFKLLTITRVDTARDLSIAKVFVSIPNGTFESFLQWIKPHLYHMQGELNQQLALYKTPRITFVEDTTGSYVDRMESLFQKIAKKNN